MAKSVVPVLGRNAFRFTERLVGDKFLPYSGVGNFVKRFLFDFKDIVDQCLADLFDSQLIMSVKAQEVAPGLVAKVVGAFIVFELEFRTGMQIA